jgi:hypothetical protein
VLYFNIVLCLSESIIRPSFRGARPARTGIQPQGQSPWLIPGPAYGRPGMTLVDHVRGFGSIRSKIIVIWAIAEAR